MILGFIIVGGFFAAVATFSVIAAAMSILHILHRLSSSRLHQPDVTTAPPDLEQPSAQLLPPGEPRSNARIDSNRTSGKGALHDSAPIATSAIASDQSLITTKLNQVHEAGAGDLIEINCARLEAALTAALTTKPTIPAELLEEPRWRHRLAQAHLLTRIHEEVARGTCALSDSKSGVSTRVCALANPRTYYYSRTTHDLVNP